MFTLAGIGPKIDRHLPAINEVARFRVRFCGLPAVGSKVKTAHTGTSEI
jgi:hypothetical protein